MGYIRKMSEAYVSDISLKYYIPTPKKIWTYTPTFMATYPEADILMVNQ